MDLSSAIVCILLLLGPLVVAAAGGYLRSIYLLCIRRCERNLADECALSFQARAIEARALNANVGYALQRAKHKVEEARQALPDARHTHEVLRQVSEWLGSAAETSDRALRSLEDDCQRAKVSETVIIPCGDLRD